LSVGLKDHVSAFSSIASVWATSGDEPFSPKTNTTISAIARLYMDSCFIHKFHIDES
jgi:hypothetical protein